MTVRVVTAAQSAAIDRAAIAAGTPSRALMQRAGAAAAAEITRWFGDRMRRGVAIFAGPGNNGGDAWVVAAALASVGLHVRVAQVGDPKTEDARAERAWAGTLVSGDVPTGAEDVVVDGLLGTGTSGSPRGAIAEAIRRMNGLRRGGAVVAALDLPSGLDADTGRGDDAVDADLTITFGAVKRGLLMARERCGRIVVVDIGLGRHASEDGGAPELIDRAWVSARIPRIEANAHKGTRKRVAVVGGGSGMVGASILAARAAMRSGVGMVRLVVNGRNVGPAQASAYEALARAWPESDEEACDAITDWAHGVLLGPGLGRSDETRALVERVLRVWSGPVVLDADALNVFEGEAPALGTLLGGRPAVVTPHVNEFSRLAGIPPREVLDSRFDAGAVLAKTLGAVVLLKGVPTVLTDGTGASLVSATGTPALAAAGSGDVLAGIAATLVTQMDDPLAAAACAAWIHGRAAELAGQGKSIRGTALDDVIAMLSEVWSEPTVGPRPPVLAELPRVGDARAHRVR